MELKLTVEASGRHWSGGVCIEVTEPMQYVFEPINTCDDPITAIATGDELPCNESVRQKLGMRKDAAKDLARVITEMLLNEMKKNDTHNGYPK